MIGPSELEVLLRFHYGLGDPIVETLASGWDGSTFLVRHRGSDPWVLRTVEATAARHDAQVLAFLDRKRYPAPRLVHTVEGANTTEYGSTSILVTTFVEGAPADFSPRTLYRLGERLGQLHALEVGAEALPAAAMLPMGDMETALRWLRPVAPNLPPGLQRTYDDLIAAIQRIRDPGHLPHCLIHNDAHPGNAIVAADGTATYIDWHGAGIGPPAVDLGFLLISSEIAPSWSTPLSRDDNRLPAIVAGYARHRVPTRAELEWLPDAVRVRSLLYGAAHLAQAASQHLDTLPETWWWERYLAAEDLAARACEEFEQYA